MCESKNRFSYGPFSIHSPSILTPNLTPSMPAPSADFGLIGLAVMGENLALNVESRWLHRGGLQSHHREGGRSNQRRAKGKKFVGCHSLQELVQSVKRPRKIMMMVKAGPPVDDLINQLLPLMEKGECDNRLRE